MKLLIIATALLVIFKFSSAQESISKPVTIFNQGNKVFMSNEYVVPVFARITTKEFSGAIIPPETYALLQPKQNTEIYNVSPIGNSRWTAVWNFTNYFGNPSAPDVGIKKFPSFLKPNSVFGSKNKFKSPIFRSSKVFEIYAADRGVVFNIVKNENLGVASIEIYNLSDDTWIDYNSIDINSNRLNIGQIVEIGDFIGLAQKSPNSNFYISQIILNRLEFNSEQQNPSYKWLEFEVENSINDMYLPISESNANNENNSLDIKKPKRKEVDLSSNLLKVPYTIQISNHLNSIKKYPSFKEAQQNRPNGVVEVSFELNRKGEVLIVKIVKSSGSSLLDNYTVSILQKTRFPPMPIDINIGESSHVYTTRLKYSADDIKN